MYIMRKHKVGRAAAYRQPSYLNSCAVIGRYGLHASSIFLLHCERWHLRSLYFSFSLEWSCRLDVCVVVLRVLCFFLPCFTFSVILLLLILFIFFSSFSLYFFIQTGGWLTNILQKWLHQVIQVFRLRIIMSCRLVQLQYRDIVCVQSGIHPNQQLSTQNRLSWACHHSTRRTLFRSVQCYQSTWSLRQALASFWASTCFEKIFLQLIRSQTAWWDKRIICGASLAQ